jgi:hypothetical protein
MRFFGKQRYSEMRQRILLLFFGLFHMAQMLLAQSNVTFAVAQGQLLEISLNGERKNQFPNRYVRVDNIQAGSYQVACTVTLAAGYALMYQGSFSLTNRYESNYFLSINAQGQVELQLANESPLLGEQSHTYTHAAPTNPIQNQPIRKQNQPQNQQNNQNQTIENSNQQQLFQNQVQTCQNRTLMSQRDVEGVKNALKNQRTTNRKMRFLKSILPKSSIMAKDIQALMRMFRRDTDRYEFATFAYEYACDPFNYYEVARAFDARRFARRLERFAGLRR